MKYLTTLEVAHELKVSKQTLLNWLYAGKIPEPPRNRKGYRLWSPSRVSLVKRLIGDGRLHKRTVVHKEPSNRREVVAEFAREVSQFLRDGEGRRGRFLEGAGPRQPRPRPAPRAQEEVGRSLPRDVGHGQPLDRPAPLEVRRADLVEVLGAYAARTRRCRAGRRR